MPTSNIRYVAAEEYIAKIKQEVKAKPEVEEAPVNSLTGRILAEDINSQTVKVELLLSLSPSWVKPPL